MKRTSRKVTSFLEWLAMNHIDNLYSEETLTFLATHEFVVPPVVEATFKRKAQKLSEQLPTGIFVRPEEVVNVISASVKMMSNDSLSYSPMALTYKEFGACKMMKYSQGNIITGREKEIETILLTLSKKSKRGSILIGEPGTGKTAIVHAINARLIERTVPRQLIGCYILNMDVPYILSKHKEDPIGTIIGILEKASEYDKAILFIDEIHQLLGQRLNDILKPYLTEKIRFIGSTTINEYHSIITDDSALERRFTVVRVNEPNVEETTNMLIGTKSIYEEHHKCSIPDATCKYLAENGSRFLGTRRNPDKSLDILDVACSIMDKSEIKDITTKTAKEKDFLKSVDAKRKELVSLKAVSGNRILSETYIDLAISSLTGISYGEIKTSTNYNDVLGLLRNEIFGQDKALSQLANVVNIFKSTKFDRVRPISVLLMVGPPGTGKKSSAQLIAQKLFGDKDYFIDYDMSGFKSEFSITELKGAPPGYVGYSKSGGLIKAVRNNPLSVVFFRGINHAHETITQYIVDCCRVGKMKDSAEREAKLNNTIIIFSVTLDPVTFQKVIKGSGKSIGFVKQENKKDALPLKALEEAIGKDIVGISDDVLIFNELSSEDLEKIYNKNLPSYLDMYNVSVDKKELSQLVMENAKNGHDVVSKLSSEVPKLVFRKLSNKEKENVKIPKVNPQND